MLSEMPTRAAQKQHTREQLVAAARTVIARQGLPETTARHIAAEAGVAVGTVFLHFPTMARLAETLLDGTVEGALATARGTLPASGLVDQLVHISSCLYDAYWVDPDLSRQVISASVFEADPQGPSSRRMADFRSWVTGLADAAVTAGSLPPISGDEVFAGFFALYFGVLVSGLRGEVDRATQPAVLRTLLVRFLKEVDA
jgi:AcrR family transcriptional regulator